MTIRFPTIVREAFKSLPDVASHEASKPPEKENVFTPADHAGALDPHRAVVVGDRGTGKSFWSSVLINRDIRNLVAQFYPRLPLAQVEGKLGFSDDRMTEDHPTPNVIANIIHEGYSAEDLWRAVMLCRAPIPTPDAPNGGPSPDWLKWTQWVATDPARRNAAFRALDETLAAQNRIYVLVFDALDLLAEDWRGLRKQIKGIIQLALAVRTLKAIRIKMFIRPDMADDDRLWAVGDASKLRHNIVELNWKRRDLYGLLWTLLANNHCDPATNYSGRDPATVFREFCCRVFNARFDKVDEVWHPSPDLIEDEVLQQKVFRALAGDYMGAGPTKGDTYKWVPNHISDAAGFAAPRSFLLAMKEAAENAKSNETVLDVPGIQAGVRKASKVRVEELSEDYRWMKQVLNDMQYLAVPLPEAELVARWQERGTLRKLKEQAATEGHDNRYIPPGDVLEEREEREAYRLLIEQMVRLKIFFRLNDGRINMPDLFRLQAKVKRKGGMKPRA
jgi:hypothetical protein